MSDTQKTILGKVISDKNDKTIVVQVERKVKHPLYEKYVKRVSKYHTHDPSNKAALGNKVRIKETRPHSKKKHWELVEVVA